MSPVFAGAPRAWQALQDDALATVRAALPGATVILTGADWGGIDGLVGLRPVADPNVIYSFHFYEPSELTALAAYRPGLDRAALAPLLPFPDGPGGGQCGGKRRRTRRAAPCRGRQCLQTPRHAG